MMKNKNLGRKIADKTAKYLISLGGIGTISAVLLVFLFLFWTVLPLFKSGSVNKIFSQKIDQKIDMQHGMLDEYGLSAVIFDGKSLYTLSLPVGKVVGKKDIDAKVTAFGHNEKSNSYYLATEHGKIVEAVIKFTKEVVRDGSPKGTPSYSINDHYLYESYENAQFRYSTNIELVDIIETKSDKKIVLIDGISSDKNRFISYLTEDKILHINQLETKENIMTGEVITDLSESKIDLSKNISGALPKYLKINSSKTSIMLFFTDGRFISIDTKDFNNFKISEEKKLFEDRKITYLDFLIGRNSILIGDNKGFVTIWWPTEDPQSKNNYVFSQIYSFYSGNDVPVKFIYPSHRDKSFLILNESGRLSMYHMTSGKHLVDLEPNVSNPQIVLLNQKNDKVVVLGDVITSYKLDIPHPEITFKSVFGKVQYELTSKPDYVWQSSSGSDDFEPKFSLIPLIFGTIKATLISMLFAVPVALLAAVYTSEFAPRRFRTTIKSTIEIMASLPSVVLGFIAALIVSPFVENIVLGFIFTFLMIPFSLIFLGHLSQFLPKEILNAMDRYRMWLILFLGVPMGIFLGSILAPFVEKSLFYGDFKLWLHKFDYSPFGGWVLVMIPFGIILALYLYRKFLYDFYESLLENRSYIGAAFIELIKFFVLTISSITISFLLAYLLVLLGLDLRFDIPFIESIMTTYVQRNALIVGFIMGFAVIPIIYTVSEDALNAVPEHLRSASLAAGATQWQTVMNIILPVAMSGIFSAIMIGFGRAIGETMIVLMAAGNTPIVDMNIFSGFRTLSANIAVELPEAVINSTHYRVLYLAALVLFIMTFIINTFAEMIRMKYRKKSSQL